MLNPVGPPCKWDQQSKYDVDIVYNSARRIVKYSLFIVEKFTM